MFGKVWGLIKETVMGFLNDDALSRAAAIAYFTIFSIGPLLIIVTAIAGLVFGRDAAQQAIIGQFSGLMGQQTTEAFQSMIKGADVQSQGGHMLATIAGVVALLVTASGAFGTMQSALNAIWKAEPTAGVSRLVRARIASLGLVLTLGFLMLVSLVISAGLAALGNWLNAVFPVAHAIMAVANFVISLVLLSAVFAAIYKFLPDTDIAWRDVAIGAVATALLFTIGKSAIGLYIGHSHIASGYGAAGALIVVLVWIYYSTLIFLLGAEFTRAYAEAHGSRRAKAPEAAAAEAAKARQRAAARRPLPLEEPVIAASPEFLARRTSQIRHEMDATWRDIWARAPRSPALGPAEAPEPAAERPSWLQLAVAGVALLVLPERRQGDGGTHRRGAFLSRLRRRPTVPHARPFPAE